MNLIKKVFLKIGSGFLYGLGFAVSIVIISLISFSVFLGKTVSFSDERGELEHDIEADLKTEMTTYFRQYDESANLVAEVRKERISENEFTLIGAIKNNGDSSWSSISLKAEIFNKDGEFIEECSEYISEKTSPGSIINFKLSCGSCTKLQLEDYHSYKLEISNAQFHRN